MRRYQFALPLLLAVLAFAGCGSSNDNDKSPSSEATAAPTAAATDAPTEAATEAASSGKPAEVKVTGKLGERPKIAITPGDAPTKLQIKDIKKGTGPKAAAGQTVSVQYDGVLLKDGKEFDASWNRPGQPFEFALGAGQVIPGWDQGIVGMQKGGRRVLTIPPDLAYGPNGSGPIGPNETLVFVVDMDKISAP